MSGRFELDGIARWQRELRRLGSTPDFRVIGRLEALLRAQFLQTQALVHIDTHSLRPSGRTSSGFDNDTWQGVIIYGGPSPGPNNPVEYAIYEMARGGSHNWFRTLHTFEHQYLDAVEAHLAGTG